MAFTFILIVICIILTIIVLINQYKYSTHIYPNPTVLVETGTLTPLQQSAQCRSEIWIAVLQRAYDFYTVDYSTFLTLPNISKTSTQLTIKYTPTPIELTPWTPYATNDGMICTSPLALTCFTPGTATKVMLHYGNDTTFYSLCFWNIDHEVLPNIPTLVYPLPNTVLGEYHTYNSDNGGVFFTASQYHNPTNWFTVICPNRNMLATVPLLYIRGSTLANDTKVVTDSCLVGDYPITLHDSTTTTTTTVHDYIGPLGPIETDYIRFVSLDHDLTTVLCLAGINHSILIVQHWATDVAFTWVPPPNYIHVDISGASASTIWVLLADHHTLSVQTMNVKSTELQPINTHIIVPPNVDDPEFGEQRILCARFGRHPTQPNTLYIAYEVTRRDTTNIVRWIVVQYTYVTNHWRRMRTVIDEPALNILNTTLFLHEIPSPWDTQSTALCIYFRGTDRTLVVDTHHHFLSPIHPSTGMIQLPLKNTDTHTHYVGQTTGGWWYTAQTCHTPTYTIIGQPTY